MEVTIRHTTRGWLKPSQAAKYAAVSVKVFRRWLADGLRHSRLPNDRILVSVAAIDEYLQGFEVKDDKAKQMADELTEGLH